MTELILKSELEQKKLDGLIRFMQSWDIDVEVKTTEEPESEPIEKEDIFSEIRGIWSDYDINIKEIRQQSHERRTKLYDNDTF
jgi:ferritin